VKRDENGVAETVR